MDSDKHDDTFMEILREEKNVAGFLDSLFGFLYRCTDFYVESTPDQRLGFPPGVAEQLVFNALHKWKSHLKLPKIVLPPVLHEEVVSTNLSVSDKSVDQSLKKSTQQNPKIECHNGAAYENYNWSQTITDIDVLVPIPENVRSSKAVKVRLDNTSFEVGLEERKLVEGRFSYEIKNSESCWCLEPGKHISFHLEKSSERWWEALLEDEPRIELSKIDCSRNLEDMGEREQMKVEELMWNQKRKLLGQPTSEQIRTEKILQKAWNADGSPFKGTEYDPSLVKFN